MPDARIHSPKPCVQQVAQLIERQVGDVHLTDLWNDEESLARYRETVGELDVAGDDKNKVVARTQFVIARYGTPEQWQELGGRTLKHVHAKHVARRTSRNADQPGIERDELPADRRKTEGVDGVQFHLTRYALGLTRCSRAEVCVQEVLGIAARLETGTHLLGRHSGLTQAGPNDVGETGLLLNGLL